MIFILILFICILLIINNINFESFNIKSNNIVKNNKNLKILIIADLERFKKKISSNRYDYLMFLNKKSNIIVTGTGCPEFKVNMTQGELINNLYGNGKPDIVYIYLLTIYRPFNKILIKTNNIYKNVLWIEDIYHGNLYLHFMRNENISNLLFQIKHNEISNKLKPFCNKIYNHCHYLNTDIFNNYNLPKKYDILFYGMLGKHYPFRTRLYYLLYENKDKFNIKFINHPTYFKGCKTKIQNKQLAKYINESYITICTNSKYNMLLKKYFEVAMSNSVIVGNIPTDYNSLFKNNIIEISENLNDNEIINKLTESLNNKNELLKMSLKFSKKINKLYNYEAGYINLNNISKKY